MSYDVSLVDPVSHETLELDAPHHMRGGTYAVGGTTQAHLNVTYNYSAHFSAVLGPEGLRGIYGLTGGQSLPILKAAAEKLRDDISDNYWEPTEGNAKRALCQLAALAEMRPDGVWEGD